MWALGRWMLLANILGAFTLQAFSWSLGAFHSPAESGTFQAIITLLGLTHPILFGLGNLLVAVSARFGQQEPDKASKAALSLSALGAIVLTPYFLLLLAFPQQALTLVYGTQSPYAIYRHEVRLLVLAYFIAYLASMLTAFINGLGKTKAVFSVQLLGAAASLSIGLPLSRAFGTSGACVGLLCVHAARFGNAVYQFKKVNVPAWVRASNA
jgi:O-antigen/teichoic acid export membrane protein